jgi:Uma2 family endonuclease
MTAQELFRLPGLQNKLAEMDHGVLVLHEPSGCRSSEIAVNIVVQLGAYVKAHALGSVTTEAGGYILSMEPPTVRAPDVAFVRRGRISAAGHPVGFYEGAPDLAVEVISPSDNRQKLQTKVNQYLDAGTRLVWVVDLWVKTVTVYRPGANAQKVDVDGVLDGEDVVPGFRLTVAEIFS